MTTKSLRRMLTFHKGIPQSFLSTERSDQSVRTDFPTVRLEHRWGFEVLISFVKEV